MSDRRDDIVNKLKADALDDGDEMHWGFKEFELVVEDCKRYFGQWDACDPVVWAILRVVAAQNDLANVHDLYAAYGIDRVEEAIAERIKAIAALQKTIKQNPRGPL